VADLINGPERAWAAIDHGVFTRVRHIVWVLQSLRLLHIFSERLLAKRVIDMVIAKVVLVVWGRSRTVVFAIDIQCTFVHERYRWTLRRDILDRS